MPAKRTTHTCEVETPALAGLSKAFRPERPANACVWHLDAGKQARSIAMMRPMQITPARRRAPRRRAINYFTAGNRALMKSTIRPAAGGSKLLSATTT